MPRYISPITRHVQEARGGLVELCCVISNFHQHCGHIVRSTACHNTENINRFLQGQPDLENADNAKIPCDANICDHTLVYTNYFHKKCIDCAKRIDPSCFDLFYDHPNGTTVIRSDPGMDEIPPAELFRRRVDQLVLTADSLRLLNTLAPPPDVDVNDNDDPEDDFYAGIEGMEPELRILLPELLPGLAEGVASAFFQRLRDRMSANRGIINRDAFYLELRQRRSFEDHLQIPLRARRYYCGGVDDITDFMIPMDATHERVAGEECSICKREDCLLADGDPRRLPCGHIYHWECISAWIYQPANRRCPMCSQMYAITPLPEFLP